MVPCHLAGAYLGPVAVLSHDLRLPLQKSIRELFCQLGRLLFLLHLPCCFLRLEQALCNLNTKNKVTRDKVHKAQRCL